MASVVVGVFWSPAAFLEPDVVVKAKGTEGGRKRGRGYTVTIGNRVYGSKKIFDGNLPIGP